MAIFEGSAHLADGQLPGGRIQLEFRFPVFRYVTTDADREPAEQQRATVTQRGSVTRTQVGTTTAAHAMTEPQTRFAAAVEGESILGTDSRAFGSWAQKVGLRGMAFQVDVAAHGALGNLLHSESMKVLFFVDDVVRSTQDESAAAQRLFLVNAAELWRVLDELGPGVVDTLRRDEQTEAAARVGFEPLVVLAALGDIVGGVFRRRELEDKEIDVLARRSGVGTELAHAMYKDFERLTSFDLTIPEVRALRISGSFAIKGQAEASRRELGFYRPVVDIPVRTAAGGTALRSVSPSWPGEGEVGLPLAFDFELEPPVSQTTIAGPITIRVKGFDGVVLWRSSYAATDETLQRVEIVVERYLPRPLEPDEELPAAPERRIRGQVVAMDPATAVAALTVVIQARRAEDPAWRLVSAGQTDGSGYFVLPYPTGAYVAAQALVSVAPDAPTDIAITGPGPDGSTVSEDFLYLLLAARPATEDDCGCGKHVGRLPDQADLIRSGEYTQDLGGGCVNVTTPNRTLREYPFTAIVRASDPDVSSYTLTRRHGGFALVGGAAKVDRSPVDLDNPIRWQDSPVPGDALTFYQAVTVATGHVLHFKAVFKADGYSLGDLVYSLPLAPGQKKQIVSYDVVNTLEAAESQRQSQGERLAAGLTDDREITDELSGGITENTAGRSKAHTSGMSAGLGLGGSVGPVGGSLGVAGGFANSSSSASQNGARGITQYFGERLRQVLTQNAEAYRELNASVVTTVRDGQQYAVTTEVVANHNHCHSLTMMYFEVLRHYAITQELAGVDECIFVPLLLTEFTPEKVLRWKDVLSASLLPVPASTYLAPLGLRLTARRAHPLLKAFDALDRVQTGWSRVDYPTGSYAEDAVTSISGEFRLRTDLVRPRTRFDRILSLPITTETTTSERVDVVGTVAAAVFSGGLSLLFGPSTDTVEEHRQVRARIFDTFMSLDDNYQSVRPADCIRVTGFREQSVTMPGGTVVTLTFFQNDEDRRQWAAYATLLGKASPEELLEQYFAGRLVSEWDTIFNRDLAPLLFSKILDTVRIQPLNVDLTALSRYNGGERTMQIRVTGGAHSARSAMPIRMRMHSASAAVHAVRSFVTLVVDNVTLRYTTAHFEGILHRGYAGGDLLDEDFATAGVQLDTPLTSQDKRNPRKEDRFLAEELIAHLNSNIEHYNNALWRGLDEDRRFMLLDGFSIETYDAAGGSTGMRSLASVVKHELIDIAGNALVFPVADGYRVSQSLIVATRDDAAESRLREQYETAEPVAPYRLSVPTRGVYMEAVLGQCDSCEPVQPNTSQDWDRFKTDEPTTIQAVTTPTPQRFDWRAVWAQFAAPIVGMQTPRELPAPGAGLSGLSDALTSAEAFRDITGLAGNQANAMQTFLSNQENARAFAEMAKGMAMQQHNSENSDQIMRSLSSARESGALPEADYQRMVRDHLGQQIDGGSRQAAERRAEEVRQPSLTNAAIQAVEEGRSVTATSTRPDGTSETVEVEPTGQAAFEAVHYDVPLVAQPNKTSCWAASMAMVESYRRSRERQASVVVSAAELAAEAGYSLEQSYGWDRLESVKDLYDFEDIPLAGSQFPTAGQWREWLATRGPLYVTVGGEPSHAIIVHGVSGDGTADGTSLEILDPWDINAAFDDDPTEFHPPNGGAALRLTITELNNRLNEGDLDELALYENWRLLYQPANAPAAGAPPAPSGGGSRHTLQLRVLNKYLETDTAVAYTASVTSAVFNLDIPRASGTGWHNVSGTIPDGDHVLVIIPEHPAAVPTDWPSFANPTAAAPAVDRIFTEERATITVAAGRVTAVGGNPNVVLQGSRITARLRPLWAHTPHRSVRTTPPTLILVHHTAGRSQLPQHFVGLPGARAAAHYVIARDGAIIKLADEATEAAWHAGEARWRGASGVNASSVGIEVVHHDDTEIYEPAQLDSLETLLTQLRAAFPGISSHDVIGHSCCSVMEITLDENVPPTLPAIIALARKPLDPGKLMDWPRLEAAGAGTTPADEATTFAVTPATEIYHGFFRTNAARRLMPEPRVRRGRAVPPAPTGDLAAAIHEIKADLAAIGYHVATNGTNDRYDDGAGRAVSVFKYRYFSGARQRPDAFYNRNLDFDTAKMIKRVRAAVP